MSASTELGCMVLQVGLVKQPSVAFGMRTIDRLTVRILAEVLLMEVSLESVPIPERLPAVL